MTVPGVRVTSVRRTVGVAVALVTGQALLCGIIGVVTFSDRSTSTPGAQAPGLVGPPAVLPSAGTPPVSVPADHPEPGTTRHGRIELPTSPSDSRAVRNPATRTTGPSRPASASPVPAPTTSSPDLSLVPPSPAAPDDDAPIPAVEGERCDDEGAVGRTAAGKAVRCERGRHGDLRWRPV